MSISRRPINWLGLVNPLLAERIPDAQLHMFAGLRHGFTGERPDEVNAVILEFLSRHAAADAAA